MSYNGVTSSTESCDRFQLPDGPFLSALGAVRGAQPNTKLPVANINICGVCVCVCVKRTPPIMCVPVVESFYDISSESKTRKPTSKSQSKNIKEKGKGGKK